MEELTVSPCWHGSQRRILGSLRSGSNLGGQDEAASAFICLDSTLVWELFLSITIDKKLFCLLLLVEEGGNAFHPCGGQRATFRGLVLYLPLCELQGSNLGYQTFTV